MFQSISQSINQSNPNSLNGQKKIVLYLQLLQQLLFIPQKGCGSWWSCPESGSESQSKDKLLQIKIWIQPSRKITCPYFWPNKIISKLDIKC